MKQIFTNDSFGNCYNEDFQKITDVHFLKRLRFLGEFESLKKIQSLRNEKNPVNMVLDLRNYFGCPPEIVLSFHEKNEEKHEVDASKISSKNGDVASGFVIIRNDGRYTYPSNKANYTISHTNGIHIVNQTILDSGSVLIHYSISVKKHDLMKSDLTETIYVSLGICHISFPIHIIITQTNSQSLLEQMKTYEELFHMTDMVSKYFILGNDVETMENPVIAPLKKWIKNSGFDDKPLEIATRTEISSQLAQFSAFVGLQEIGKSNAPRFIRKHSIINQDQMTMVLLEAAGGRRNYFINKNKLSDPGIKSIKYYLSYIDNEIIKNTDDSKYCDYHTVRLKFIKKFPYRLLRAPVFSNKGLTNFKLFGKIWLLKEPFFHYSAFTDVLLCESGNKTKIRYQISKKYKSYDIQSNEERYDWRLDYYRLCINIRILLASNGIIDKEKKDILYYKAVDYGKQILEMMHYNSFASKKAIEAIFVLGAVYWDKSNMLFDKALLSVIGFISIKDYIISYFNYLNFYTMRMKIVQRYLPKDWSILKEPYSSKLQGHAVRCYFENPVAFLHSVNKNIEIIESYDSSIVGDTLDKYREAFHQAKIEFPDIEKALIDVFKNTVPEAHAIRIMLWRLLPSSQLANLYAELLYESDFHPSIFNELLDIFTKCDIEYVNRNSIIRRMIQWQSSIEKPNLKFFEFLQKTIWSSNPVVVLFSANVQNDIFFKNFILCPSINTLLAANCEKRLEQNDGIHNYEEFFAFIKLKSINYVYSDFIESNSSLTWPLKVRFCYFGKQMDSGYRELWANNHGMQVIFSKVSSVYIEEIKELLPSMTFTINRRNIRSDKLKSLYSDILKTPLILMEMLKMSFKEDGNEYGIEEYYEYFHEMIHVLCKIDTDEIENEKRKIPEGDWIFVARILERLLKYYRPSYNFYIIEYLLKKIRPESDNHLYSKLQGFSIRLDSGASKNDSIAVTNQNINLKIIKAIEEYNSNNITEIALRRVFTNEVLPNRIFHPSITLIAIQCFRLTNLYFPYGEYLVKTMERGNISKYIVNDNDLLSKLILLTNDYDFRISSFILHDNYGPECILALSLAWSKYGRITENMKNCLDRLIYRIKQRDISMIYDLLIEYCNLYPEKNLFIFEMAYQMRSRNCDFPKKLNEKLASIEYKDFIKEFSLEKY